MVRRHRLGLSGSQGNTDTLKLRAGLDLRYDDPNDFAILNVLYILNQANQGKLENKAFALVRNEMPMDMGLAWYAQGAVEYDEFRTVYLRVGVPQRAVVHGPAGRKPAGQAPGRGRSAHASGAGIRTSGSRRARPGPTTSTS